MRMLCVFHKIFLAFSNSLYYTSPCRKVTFYNPLLIIYTPLKRPMAPPSVFYFFVKLYYKDLPLAGPYVILSYQLVSYLRFEKIRNTSTIIRAGIINGAINRITPVTTVKTSTIARITPKITSTL